MGNAHKPQRISIQNIKILKIKRNDKTIQQKNDQSMWIGKWQRKKIEECSNSPIIKEM